MSLETWTSARGVRAADDLKDWRSRGRAAGGDLGRRLALAFYVALALYCALSLLFGQEGLIAYSRLEERKAAMAANLELLGAKRESLNAELESLKSDPDRAALEARSMGYLRKGETEIILGERSIKAKGLDSGSVLPYARSGGLSDSSIKEIALGAFLAMLACLYAPRRKEAKAAQRQEFPSFF
jgi:cell division protein FtsB